MNDKQESPTIPAGYMPTVLVIDDTKTNLTVIGSTLKLSYRVLVASTGQKGLELAAGFPRPDLILLDIMMPGMDGYEVLEKLQTSQATRDIPIIFVTAMNSEEDEERGLAMGAVDYITKPIHGPILLARVRTHISLKRIRDQLKSHNLQLEAKVQERTEAMRLALERAEAAHTKLRKTYFGMLRSFAELAELRGGMLSRHSQRVADMSRQVALRMGLSDEEIQDIFVAALLHDIGMIGFPDSIYQKPVAGLTGDDLHMYRQHPIIGATLLAKIDTMADVAEIISHHHEHYDGTGYPNGISGLEIPIGARIIHAASDYDDLKNGVLMTQRLTPKQCCQYLLDQRGRRYDPLVVDTLEPLLTGDENFEIDEVRIEALHLQDGMVLSREILHPDGFLLLSKGTLMTRRKIDQLVDVEKRSGKQLEIFVNRQVQNP